MLVMSDATQYLVSELISLQPDPVVLTPVKGRKRTTDERRWVIQRILVVPKKWNEKKQVKHTTMHIISLTHTHSHTYRRLSTVGRQWDKCTMTASRHLWDCQIPQR